MTRQPCKFKNTLPAVDESSLLLAIRSPFEPCLLNFVPPCLISKSPPHRRQSNKTSTEEAKGNSYFDIIVEVGASLSSESKPLNRMKDCQTSRLLASTILSKQILDRFGLILRKPISFEGLTKI